MSTFTIYCCRLDNEAYVGATNRPLARRQSEHKCGKTGAHDIAMRGGTYQVLETAFLRERVPCCECGKVMSRRNLARHQNHYCLQVTTEKTITPVVTVESEHEPVTL